MNTLRTAIAFGAVGALALGLTACQGGGDAAESGSASSAGGLVYVVPTSWANVAVLTEAVDAYNADAASPVTLQAIPDENYNSVVGSRLAGGTDIDIFAGTYTLFDVPNVMVDLTGEPFLERLTEAGVASLTASDGKIYSFPSPTPGATFGVFYNTKVFEEAGVAVPTSLTEMTEAMKALKAKGTTPLFLAGKNGWTLLQHRNSVNPLMNLDGDTISKLDANEMRWDEVPALTDQYNALESWAKEGFLNEDVLTATYEESLKAVVDGSAAMIINGSWAIGEMSGLADDAATSIGFFPLPSAEGRTMLGLSGADGLHIAKSSANVEGAKAFLSYLASPEVAQKFMDAAPGISNFTDVTVPEKAPKAMTDIATAIEKGASTLAIDNASVVPAPESDLIAAYQQLVAGQMSAADFLTTEADGMIASGKAAGIPGF